MNLFFRHYREDASKSRYEYLEEECKFLFSRSFLTKQDKSGSCSICCNRGWYGPLKKLCCKLEALNLTYYGKYRVRIEAQQVKEKYGTLRFYYQVGVDPSPFKMLISKMLLSIYTFMYDNIDFKYKDVTDTPAFVAHEVVELDKSRYIEEKLRNSNCSNVKCERRDGKYFKTSDINHYRSHHRAPTKHKIINCLMMLVQKASVAVNSRSVIGLKSTSKQHVIVEMLSSLAEQYVRDAEKECFNVCEMCGSQIGTDWSPRCETTGYIRYLCDSCAAEDSNTRYMKNGEMWCGKNRIQEAKS